MDHPYYLKVLSPHRLKAQITEDCGKLLVLKLDQVGDPERKTKLNHHQILKPWYKLSIFVSLYRKVAVMVIPYVQQIYDLPKRNAVVSLYLLKGRILSHH